MIAAMQDQPLPARRDRTVAAGPAPDRARLREAALAHLSRYAASEAGLLRVLNRRIRRWAQRAGAEGAAPGQVASQVAAQSRAARDEARLVVARLVADGVLDDGAYAEARARSLARSGRSRRATLAHLAGRGVDAELARSVLPADPDTDLAAAVLQARRRRIGPYADGGGDAGADAGAGAATADAVARNRALAALGRAGFDRDTAERALGLDRAAADALILALRRG